MPEGGASLVGVQVLVTRPPGQGEALCRAIEAGGGSAHHCPMLEIAPADRPPPAWWRGYDWLIFVSANAVRFALGAGLPAEGPPRLAAIGRATAAALAQAGREVACQAPPPYTSESLLAQPPLERVRDRRILIVRGVGGRGELARVLAGRGARVDHLELYRRLPPAAGTVARLRDLLARQGLDVVLASSGEVLANLEAAAGGWLGRLRGLPLIVVSPRLAGQARRAGFAEVIEAASAMDEAVLAALTARFGLK